jgi:AraC-like DNA-binding protein
MGSARFELRQSLSRRRHCYSPRVRVAGSEEEFRRAPIGACVYGQSFLYFCARPHLCGFALWGRPDGEAFRRLEALLRIELDAGFPPHVSLVDASRLEGVDAAAFGVLHAYVSANHARLAEQVEHLAIVRPPGLPGATVAGFFQVARPPYPVDIEESAAAALAKLGEPDDGVLDELAEAIASASGMPPLLVSLQKLLDADPGRVSLEDAARKLGLSARSLQRRLNEVSSTYQAELARSQVRVAQRLLRESNTPLTAIAFEVGCATPQHFSTLFRRLVGESPSAWRARVQDPPER